MANRLPPVRALARVVAAVAVMAAGPLAAPVAVVTPAGAAEADLEAAQRRADQAAAELSRAEEEMARAEDAVAHLQSRVARLDARASATREMVRDLAVRLYVEGTAPLSRLLRLADASTVVQARQYSQIVAGDSADALRRWRADREDLSVEVMALERGQESRAASVERLRRRQAEVTAEIERLVKAAEQARAAEERRRSAEAAARTPGNRSEAVRPATGAAPSALATPAASAAPAPSGGWVCPVQGPLTFSNDYGAARGGGSSHMGNDILAARGTPVVANVDGVVTHRTGAISGLAYYLAGDDGNRYFGAHLDSFGASGRVTAGTVIGTVGNTGDAVGGPPHLHFEIHPGGTGNVNPYTTLRQYC